MSVVRPGKSRVLEENTNMATSADKSHSTMWARFHNESPNKIVKLLRKSKSMDTLLEASNWTLKDIPEYDTVGTLLPTSLPTVPLTKWETLLHQHGEEIFLHPKRNSTTSRSCPSLLCRTESAAAAFTVHCVVQSRSAGNPSIAIRAEDVSGAEKNRFAAEQDSLSRWTDDSKATEEVNQKDAFFSWAFERAENSNIKHQVFEEFAMEEKEGLILENDYLSPTVTVHKLVLMPGVDTKHDDIQDQAYQQMEVAAKPEHLEQVGSMETFDYSFTKSKTKSCCTEEEMKLVVKDKAEIDNKNKQSKFSLEHYQGLDVDLKYSEELFDEIDDDEESTELETQTILCLPFLCWKRRNKHKEEEEEKKGTSCFGS
ncbi:uncharacterized protein LOC119955872 isoform X1 [Scyliorhinus canicula]|uniref:uncharacterized protein LOC119955872 isoform X1 n=1 Tax=Scyliorhinus canicula TaxID=7830 RepID=UPI0018F4DA5F|nr:uncharacterized protein LOC119955872 isoform X1 [Scyliorhinus canicula]